MKFEEAKKTRDPNYRVMLYKKNEDGKIIHEVFGIDDAVAKTMSEGWKMSPAEFSDNPDLVDDPNFNQMCDEISKDMNMVLNIDEILDPRAIESLLERMFGVKIRSDAKIETMRKRVVTEAKIKGIL